jgi:hypothetical protein
LRRMVAVVHSPTLVDPAINLPGIGHDWQRQQQQGKAAGDQVTKAGGWAHGASMSERFRGVLMTLRYIYLFIPIKRLTERRRFATLQSSIETG